MVMENDKLKKKIQRNIKENIAISNFKEERDMKNLKSKKVIYSVLASCAMFVLCAGIMVSHLNKPSNELNFIKIQNLAKQEDITSKLEININHLEEILKQDYAIDAVTRKIDAHIQREDLEFAIDCKLPSDFEKEFNVQAIYVKGQNSKQYNVLHNYQIDYFNKDKTKDITLCFGFGDKKPVRCYDMLDVAAKSKIDDVELEIKQYKDLFLVIFSHKNINFDIETKGITQTQLVEFLQSLIEGVNHNTKILDKANTSGQ